MPVATIHQLVVSGGSIYEMFSGSFANLIPGGTGALSTVTFGVQSQLAFRNVYYVDGVNYVYVKGSVPPVAIPWVAAEGTLPTDVDGNKARLISLYRGRIMLAGFEKDGQNWYASATDAPLDWDVSPNHLTATRAVSGNNEPRVGLCPNTIMGMVPFTDDLMLFGGDHALWTLRGDPAEGGRFDMLSDQTGMAWGRAWCSDHMGNVYFWGTTGIYRVTKSLETTNLTLDRLDDTVNGVNHEEVSIKMAWDIVKKGVHVFVTYLEDNTHSTHYFWSSRPQELGGGWWKVQYPKQHGPTAVAVYDADDPDDRTVLIGGFDSYIRKLDQSATNDDGKKIYSYVNYPVIRAGGNYEDTMITSINTILSDATDSLQWQLLAGDNVQSAIDATPIETGLWVGGGRMMPIGRRIRDNAVILRLRNTTTNHMWSIEEITVEYERRGKTREF